MTPKAFLAIVGTVYHQPVSGQPTGVPRTFQIPVFSDAEPLLRRVHVNAEWQPLEKHWLDSVGYVELFNEAGLGRTVYPSEEEKTKDASAVIEVSFSGGIPAIPIRPGQSVRFEPCDFSIVRIRCAVPVVCSVSLWPK
jgi:hypothetical protein